MSLEVAPPQPPATKAPPPEDDGLPTVTLVRVCELLRKVKKGGVKSLSPEERKEWPQVEKWSAELAANPACQRAMAALKEQHPAFVKADRITSGSSMSG